MNAVAVISKLPRRGHTKTRLARALGADAAHALHHAFLRDELEALAGGPWALYLVHDAPRDASDRALLAELGVPGVVPGAACLPEELLGALGLLLRDHERVVIVSGDVPHLAPGGVADALAALDTADVVLGPGPDGGYWLVAMKAPHDVFTPVPMGGDRAERATVAVARSLGLEVAWVAPLTDVDEAQDLLALPPDRAPRTRALLDRLARSEVALRLPTELQVEVTSRCNLPCETCILTHARPNAATDLRLDDFRRIAEGLTLGRVAFQLNGEPLLNPDLFGMIAHAHDRGAWTVVNSNGTLLDPRRCRALVEAGLDELRISVDSVDPATHAAVVGADVLARVLAGVRNAVAARVSGRPRIGLWMVATRSTLPGLPDLVRAAAELGADEVFLQRLVLTGHGVAVAAESVHGRAADYEEVFREAEALAAQSGVALRASGRLPPRESLSTANPDNPREGCWRPWRSAVVTAQGQVLPCCIASFTTPYAELTCGRVGAGGQPWAEVYNGERYRAIRRGILDGTPAPACRGCGERWSL